ncbi:unnamed protein product [Brassica rapa subsp. narinosa]
MKIHLVILLVLSIYATPTLAKPARPFILKLVRHKAEKNSKLYITKESDATISHLTPNREPPVFLAKLSIGEPPVPQLLHVDTGSSFTWVKCGGCITCQTQFPGYNPTASSTYSSVSCDDSSYESSPALSPVKRTGECHYRQMYFDGSESRGTLAKETILFDTEDDGIESVSNVEFGCAHEIIVGFNVGTGLLGLAYGKFSILKQFSNKFSLCFETFSDDPSSGHSFLALGDGARTTGQSTSLFMRYGHYHVDVERISIDGRTINIPNQLTPIGNTIIDTGTSMLNLAEESYSEFKTHIDSLLDGHLNSFMDGHLVCYNGTIQHELPQLPTVTLTFYKGASLELDPTSLFHQLEDEYFCLSVMMSPKIDLSIIGTNALQSYNIGFDLDNETIYFDKISCDYLD